VQIIRPVERFVERRSNGDGHHGQMYFDIALHYHATIKVEQHEQNNLNTLKRLIITAPHRLPSHTGSGMLQAKVVAAGSNQP